MGQFSKAHKCSSSKCSLITPLLIKLHQIPINFGVHFNIGALNFRALYRHAAVYIGKLLHIYIPSIWSGPGCAAYNSGESVGLTLWSKWKLQLNILLFFFFNFQKDNRQVEFCFFIKFFYSLNTQAIQKLVRMQTAGSSKSKAGLMNKWMIYKNLHKINQYFSFSHSGRLF